MKVFACGSCGSALFFENRFCGTCGHRLGYLPALSTLSALEQDGALFVAIAAPEERYRFCANAAEDVCNWLIAHDSSEVLCAACRHNRTIPDLAVPGTRERWGKLEVAKHRLIYSLLRLRIALPNRRDDPARGLAFDFLDEVPGGPAVMTGHDRGVITLAAKEADDAVREGVRHDMRESYRTLLGHIRHETGHWIWDRLVLNGRRIEECRALFGDDRADYQAALQRYYAEGPRPNWAVETITAYASSHPWEDFAETWAHYLHIVDTLETAQACGISVGTGRPPDPYEASDMEPLLDAWFPLVFAVNSLNRSMGLGDLYPFVIGPAVREKLAFMHCLTRTSVQS